VKRKDDDLIRKPRKFQIQIHANDDSIHHWFSDLKFYSDLNYNQFLFLLYFILLIFPILIVIFLKCMMI